MYYVLFNCLCKPMTKSIKCTFLTTPSAPKPPWFASVIWLPVKIAVRKQNFSTKLSIGWQQRYQPVGRHVWTLQWRHNEHNGFSNHQPHDYLLSRLLRHRWKKTSKLRVTGLCQGNSLVTGEFCAQRASNAEKVFIWWRHHELVGNKLAGQFNQIDA